VDIVGHWIGGHEPGNFGLFHMALERGMISTVDPADIPVYEWDAESGAALKALDEFQRYPLKTNYLQRNYNGADEDYWHMVDEHFDYSSVSGTNMLVSPLPFNLGENFPNPFSEQTYIPYRIRNAGHVLIEVYNEQGRRVDILVNGRMARGNHMVAWNSSNRPPSIYLCRMHFEGMRHTGKMMLVR
jgi:hypothetical protein